MLRWSKTCLSPIHICQGGDVSIRPWGCSTHIYSELNYLCKKMLILLMLFFPLLLKDSHLCCTATGKERWRGVWRRRSTSHKHTYLASCHHVGEFGMLIDCQAQNVVAVFCIEALAGCEETRPQDTLGSETLAFQLVSSGGGAAGEAAPRPLTGRQVEHDADRRGVVDDVRPLVQVVHVVAAVGAAIAEHQLQHQILREESDKKTNKRGQKSQKGQRHGNWKKCWEAAGGWCSTMRFN